MRRFVVVVAAMAAATLIIGAAAAAARPQWLPALVRDRLPTATATAAGAEAEGPGPFCREHGVPEAFCTFCHEELNRTLDLCDEHGQIPEAVCTRCHPEAEKKYGITMCPKGHGLPAEFCVECGKATPALAALPDDGWCAPHDRPEELCDECKFDPRWRDDGPAGTRICREPLPTVRLASAKLAEQVGIRTVEATRETHAHTLTTNAETAYDGNAYAGIAPRVAGFLHEVRADLGKAVKRGETLAVVDSAEVSAAEAQYITAHAAVQLAQATYDRAKSLARTGSMPAKAEFEALTALNQAKAGSLDARQKLRNFGFDRDGLDRVVRDEDTTSLLNVTAPLDGVVVLRHAVRGEPVQATTELFAVADTSRMWLWIDVYESDVARVKPGQKLVFSVSGGDETRHPGAINWIGTEVDPQTRTTRARAEVENPDGRLRANQFGQVEIELGEAHEAVVVPRSAVQRKDGVDVVFVPGDRGGVYVPRRVVTAVAGRDDVAEIAWGVDPGQRVVSKGAFLLKTEIMKGAIGAGCCE